MWRSLHRESCTVDVDLTEKYPVDENNRGFQYYQKSIQQKTLMVIG